MTDALETPRLRWGWVRSRGGAAGWAAFAFLDRLAEEEFDLTVDTAQFVLRPSLEIGPKRRIDAQEK